MARDLVLSTVTDAEHIHIRWAKIALRELCNENYYLGVISRENWSYKFKSNVPLTKCFSKYVIYVNRGMKTKHVLTKTSQLETAFLTNFYIAPEICDYKLMDKLTVFINFSNESNSKFVLKADIVFWKCSTSFIGFKVLHDIGIVPFMSLSNLNKNRKKKISKKIHYNYCGPQAYPLVWSMKNLLPRPLFPRKNSHVHDKAENANFEKSLGHIFQIFWTTQEYLWKNQLLIFVSKHPPSIKIF